MRRCDAARSARHHAAGATRSGNAGNRAVRGGAVHGGAVLLVFSLMFAGCASPYVYNGGGCTGPCELSGRYGDCGAAAPCSDCDVVGVEAMPCDAGCGPAPCGPCAGTLTGLLHRMVTCNAGCGEVYWGEWCYDPPDACDPCNNHGDFVGPGCCGPSCWSLFWRGLHGERYCPVGCTTGCAACCDVPCGGEPACGCDTAPTTVIEGEMYESGEPIMEPLEPVPAPQPQIRSEGSSVLRRGPRPYYSRDPNSRLVRRPHR